MRPSHHRDVRSPTIHTHPPPPLPLPLPLPPTTTTTTATVVTPVVVSPAVVPIPVPNGVPTMQKLAIANEQTWLLIGISQRLLVRNKALIFTTRSSG